MAELIRQVGASLVGFHHRLILVIPVLSETALFSVDVKIFDNILACPHAQSIHTKISK